VTIDCHTALLIHVLAMTNGERDLGRAGPKQVFRRILVLVDTNEVKRHRVDGDYRRICEHGTSPFLLRVAV